jgi:8-oxo-dGTP pyrophosphatase MutT (NUDIX family)
VNAEVNVELLDTIYEELVKMKIRMRASLVCKHHDRILMVQLQDPMTKVARWFPPGGGIDAGETPADAAVREAFEESGYRVRALHERAFVSEYPFEFGGTLYQCTTHWFLGELAEPFREPTAVENEPLVLGAGWFSADEVDRLLSFNRDIHGAVMKLLRA